MWSFSQSAIGFGDLRFLERVVSQPERLGMDCDLFGCGHNIIYQLVQTGDRMRA